MIQEKSTQEESTEPVIIHEKISKKSGEVIMKKYLRGKVLGKGGFATCYELTDVEKNKLYAAKIVAKASLTKKRALEKLLAEIKIHKSLQHENIVHFEHVFEDKENVYILLEICPNQTLKELIKKQKRLTEPECATYMVQTINALRHLHSKKIIHRDLKLGNLLIGKSMEIKVADFGLAAKIEQDGERRRTICGTPNYIAPEVLDKKTGHSYEVDVWSMGVICYTLLIGRPPFETNDTKTTYRKILKANYVFPTNIQISEVAKDLIKKILVLEPTKRPTLDEILEHPFVKTNYTRTLTLPSRELNLNTSGKRGISGWQANLSPGNVAFLQTPQGNDILISQEKDIDENEIYQNSLKKDDRAQSMTNKRRVLEMKREFAASGSIRTFGALNDRLNIKPDYEFYVSKWMDYSSKYGLGYLLSDGTTGVVFKDQTRITLAPEGSRFEYTKRMPEQNKEVLLSCTAKEYPKELEKKFMLVNYFKNYLEGNKNEPGERVIDNNQPKPNENIKNMPLIYVKKWMKTKYAFLFRLSNRIVQVDFTDKTRIVLSSSNQVVCYKNKKGEVSQHNLETALETDYPEMVKRLKYAKDILSYLKNNSNKDENNQHNERAQLQLPDLELMKLDSINTPLHLKDIMMERTPDSNVMGGKSRVLEN